MEKRLPMKLQRKSQCEKPSTNKNHCELWSVLLTELSFVSHWSVSFCSILPVFAELAVCIDTMALFFSSCTLLLLSFFHTLGSAHSHHHSIESHCSNRISFLCKQYTWDLNEKLLCIFDVQRFTFVLMLLLWFALHFSCDCVFIFVASCALAVAVICRYVIPFTLIVQY